MALKETNMKQTFNPEAISRKEEINGFYTKLNLLTNIKRTWLPQQFNNKLKLNPTYELR